MSHNNKKISLKKKIKTIEYLMIHSYNSGYMCKGCLTVAMSPYLDDCPIHKELI